jgi:hypothetical protein
MSTSSTQDPPRNDISERMAAREAMIRSVWEDLSDEFGLYGPVLVAPAPQGVVQATEAEHLRFELRSSRDWVWIECEGVVLERHARPLRARRYR